MMDIEHWRKEIDEVDAELLRLLNIRARLALKVGALKKAASAAVSAIPIASATCSSACRTSTPARSTIAPFTNSSGASFANREESRQTSRKP